MNEPEAKVTEIRPGGGWVGPNFPELWEYRGLLWALAARNISVRYKQTFLGIAWAALQPLVAMGVFTLFLGKLGGLEEKTPGTPYALLTLCGLVPWFYFSTATTMAVSSLVESSNMIRKTYFPRILLPLTPVVSGLVDIAIALAILLGMILLSGVPVGPRLLALPLFVGLAAATISAAGLWLSGLAAYFRDVRYLTQFLLQAWMFVSPVAYSATLVPEDYRPLYDLNPMVGVVEGFRWCVLGGSLPGYSLAASGTVVALALVTGLFVFRRLESSFVDVV